MGALKPGVPEPASSEARTRYIRAFDCTGRPLRRAAWITAGERSRTAPNTAWKTSPTFRDEGAHMPGRGRRIGAAVAHGLGLDDGRQRRSRDLEGRARRFYTDVLSHAHRPPSRVCPVVEAYPQQPRNFWTSCTSMIRCALLMLILEQVRFRRSSLRLLDPADFGSELAAAFLRQGLQRPACAALRHVVRCDEYRPSRRRT